MNKWTLLVIFLIMFIGAMFQVVILGQTYQAVEPVRQYNQSVERPEMSIHYCPYCGSEVEDEID